MTLLILGKGGDCGISSYNEVSGLYMMKWKIGRRGGEEGQSHLWQVSILRS